MKVLQVIDRLNIGGAERVMLNITHLLAERNIEVGVLLFNQGFAFDKDIDKRAKLFVLNRNNKFSIAKLHKTFRTCSEYEIVHVHMRHCYRYIKLAQLLFGGKFKVILHDHYGNIEIDKNIPSGFNSILKPAYYIGVSQTLTTWALTALKTNPLHTYLLPNTILLGKPIDHNSRKTEQKVFMVSNIRETKNIEFAISLFQRLKWDSTIYGNKADDKYFDKITSLIQGDPIIKIVSGKTDFADVYKEYAIAVHCGVSETGPLVLLEYLANGIPFIAYKTGDVSDTVAKELPLHFMDSFDVDEWTKRIQEILKQEDLTDKLKNVFKKHFSPDKYIDECLRIYQEVLY